MKYLIALTTLMLGACASNYLRVTEYSGATLPLPGTNAAAGGCMVSVEGDPPPGTLTYEGERCTYTSTPQADQ